MPKTAKKKTIRGSAGRRLLARFATLAVVAGLIVAVAMTALFVFNTLKTMSGDSFRLSEEDREAIETIDLKRLSELRAKIDQKNSLDEPRAGRLRNPFAEPEPEPIVVTEPTEESPTEEPTDVTTQ